MKMVRAWILLALLILCASPALGDEAADLATMAARVTHYPTKFRLIAKGRAAVPVLMAQVPSGDARLAFESKSALHWIVNHARRDGTEIDALAEDLVGYLQSEAAATSAFAVELLGDLGCPRAVTALGGLAGTEQLGAAAVEALGRIPGDAATNLLVKLGYSAKGKRRAAVFRALGARGSQSGVPPLVRAAKEGDPEAIAALGRLGFPSTADLLFGLCDKDASGAFASLLAMASKQPDTAMLGRLYDHAKDDAQRRRVIAVAADGPMPESVMMGALGLALKSATLRGVAQHAFLRLAAHFDAGVAAAVYTRILAEAEDEAIVLRALTALGRCGGPEATTLVMPFVTAEKPSLRTTAIAALGGIPGKAATDGLIDVLSGATDPALQSLLVRTLGRRDPAEVMAPLLAWMETAKGDVKTQAAETVIALAAKGPVDAARQVHLRLLAGGMVEPALRGLVRTGDAGAVAPIAAALGGADEQRRVLGAEALSAIAGRLVKAGDAKMAVQAYRAALDAGAMVENELRLLGESIEITARAGRVSAWWLIGPFDAPDMAAWEKAEFPEATVALGKSTTVGSRTLRWVPAQVGGDDAILDLDSRYTPNDNAVAYAFTEIHVKKARAAVLKMGSDDGIRCWLNGQLVHTAFEPRGVTVDEDEVSVQLREGRNTLLVKVCEIGGGWAFCVRIEDDKGRPLKFKMR